MSQGTLVSRYVSYVDKNSQLLIADKEGNKDEEVKKICEGVSSRKGDKGHNAAEISRIMTGKKLFTLSANVNSISVNEYAKLFNDNMSSIFLNDDKPLLMLSLLDIIYNYEDIRENLSESFIESIEGEGISFPRFMIELLLLSADNKVPHKQQRDCLEAIVASMSAKLRGKQKYLLENSPVLKVHIDSVLEKYPEGTYTWDNNKQTLRIVDKSLFQGKNLEKSEKDIKRDDFSNINTHNYNGATIKPIDVLPRNISSNSINTTSSLSSISIPKEYRSCRFCQGCEINKVLANNNESPYLGTCLISKQDVLKNSNICDKFIPNYSAMTTHMLTYGKK